MKHLFLFTLLLFEMNLFAQDYWTSEFKTISSFSFEDGVITLEKKIDLKNYRSNPDGWKFYKTTLAVGITKNGEKKLNTIETDIYTAANYTVAMIPCMLVDNNKNIISIFSNSKASDRMYGMDGFVYRIDMNSKTWVKETIFTNANFGWYSFFGGSVNGNPELCHFSYAGYYSVLSKRNNNGYWNTENQGSIKPEYADKQYYTHNNILVASIGNIDRMRLLESNYYTNYQPNNYNSGGSNISLNDIIEGVEVGVASWKIISNLWTIGTSITDNSQSSNSDDFSKRVLKCATLNKISAISENQFISATLSESVKSVMNNQKLTLENIGTSTLENLIASDLDKRGYNNITQMLEATSFIKCLSGK